MAGPAGRLLSGSHARRASEGSLTGLERRAEIAFQRDRDREGGGLAQQISYFNRLPKMWRAMYVLLAVLVFIGLCMKMFPKGSARGAGSAGGDAALLAGRNITKASVGRISAAKDGASSFVRRDGARLVLEGKPFYFSGFCNYYMLTRAADKRGSGRKEVVQTLQKAQELGFTVLRMWAFADGPDEWNALQPQLERLDEDVFADGLDYLVAEAKNYGIRLLLSLTNGDTGFGGMEQYVRWAHGGAKGGSITDFYTSKDLRESYKKYVGTIITRKNTRNNIYYRDDPTIFGWEVANEPSNPGDDTGDLLQAWIEDLAAFVKSLDPNHLVTVGSTGWYGVSTPERWLVYSDGTAAQCLTLFCQMGKTLVSSVVASSSWLAFNPPAENVNSPLTSWHHPFDAACLGADFVRNQMGSDIDLMQLHMYPDSWLRCDEACKRDWSIRWLRSHFEDATRLGKPIILGEFGKLHHGGMRQRRAFLESVYAEVEAWNAQHGNVAGTFLWMLAADTYADYDGFTIYTTKRASRAPQPKRPELNAEHMLQVQERQAFMNWDASVACMARRAMPNGAGNEGPWVSGWNATLSIIEQHVKSLPLLQQTAAAV